MGENFEWNLSESKIDDIAYETIISIIKDYGTLEINKLIPHLIARTQNIKSKKYNKNILLYLKIKHKGILKFIEKFFAFNVIKTDKNIFISVNINNINMKPFDIEEWVIIDDY